MSTHDLSILKASFAQAKVSRIAIVDDGYDPPAVGNVGEASFNAFRTALRQLGSAHDDFKRSLDGGSELPSYANLTPTKVRSLWEVHQRPPDGGGDEDRATVLAHLRAAFRAFATAKSSKLAELRAVEELAAEMGGAAPAKLPSSVQARELANLDLVFLDFFLGDEGQGGGAEAARARACKLIKQVSGSRARVPLIVVISSRAAADDAPAFRDEAELIASKFRFLSKGEIARDHLKTEYVLTGLLAQRDDGDALERLIVDWKDAITTAADDLVRSVRRLDLAEYAYLNRYRLTEEKVALLPYVTWMYNSYLGSLVERRLATLPRDLFSRLQASVDQRVPSQLPPLPEIARIFAAVTTTEADTGEDGKGRTCWTGDLFVKRRFLAGAASPERPTDPGPPPVDGGQAVGGGATTASVDPSYGRHLSPGPSTAADGSGADVTSGRSAAPSVAPAGPGAGASSPGGEGGVDSEGTYEEPDILAVVTPVCDLVPGRQKAKTVALLGGTLSRLGSTKTAGTHLFFREPGQPGERAETYQIEWSPKWPIAYPLASFDGLGIRGTDYVRSARLRDLYALEVSQKLSGDLARVGVPVAPPFSYAADVVVVAREGKSVVTVMRGTPEQGYAWEMHPTRDKAKREVVFTDAFIWALRAAAAAKLGEDNPARILIEDATVWRALTRAGPLSANATALVPALGKLVMASTATLPPTPTLPPGGALVCLWVKGQMKE